MKLDLEKLLNNPAATVTLVHPAATSGGRVTTGLVEADFNIGMSSLFQDSDDGSTAQGALNRTAQAGGNLAGSAQRVIKAVQQTVSQWNGSTKPTFSIPITLVKYKKSIKILDELANLYAGVAPTYEGLTIVSPHKYTTPYTAADITSLAASWDTLRRMGGSIVDGAASPIQTLNGLDLVSGDSRYWSFRNRITGTWAISYSTWFRAHKLVLLSVSSSISKETVKGTNEPLYARVNLEFQPAILPSRDEVMGWFLRDADYGSNNTNSFGGPR